MSHGCKILVIDDEPITRMDIREMLQEEGYAVIAEGKNGEEAIELAHKWQPDLIVMDVKMPVMDGIKAAGIIRKTCDSAVLLLTAYSQKELVGNAKEAGVAAYLVKPVSEEDLIPAVEIALSQRCRVQSLKKDITDLKQKMEERKTIERAKGMIMKTHALSETEAYDWLRNNSMKLRIPMMKLASQILGSNERLKTH